MKKLSLLILLLLLTPQITLAAWWNPLSWFNNWGRSTQQVETRELDEKSRPKVVGSDELDQFVEKEEPKRDADDFDRTYRSSNGTFLDTSPKDFEKIEFKKAEQRDEERSTAVEGRRDWLNEVTPEFLKQTMIQAIPPSVNYEALAKELKAEVEQLDIDIETLRRSYENDRAYISSATQRGEISGGLEANLSKLGIDYVNNRRILQKERDEKNKAYKSALKQI